jgi:DNA adenine methylase
MKTPISYYGGKQTLAPKILEMIPEHTLYCEPFVGGGAVFFQKPKSVIEVLNDTNRELINFYQVVQRDFIALEREVRITLHSRKMHQDASVVYNNPHMFSEIKRAWALWTLSHQSFSAQIDGSFGYDKSKKNTTAKKIMNKRESFTEKYAIRLQDVQIECTDALRVIGSRDTKESFFYCDPPYVNSDCGHYDGYTWDDFEALLRKLASIEGKFLLSSYPSEMLDKYTKANGWYQKEFQMTVSVANNGKPRKKKVEVFTSNYPI